MNGQPWSQEDVVTLRALYPCRPTTEIAALLARSVGKIYQKAARLGLLKTAEFLASPESGRLRKGETRPGTEIGQFPKGNVPHNKGLRRPGWAPGRMAETQFKKGERSGVAAERWKPVGTILADPEGYLRIKMREREPGDPPGWCKAIWPLVHHQEWERHNRPIPAGQIVAFKNGDRTDCAIENLELISRKDLARRNQMWNPENMPRELAEVIQLNGALKRKLRSLHGQEQA